MAKHVHVQSKSKNTFDVYNNKTGEILGEIIFDVESRAYQFVIDDSLSEIEPSAWDSIMEEVEKMNDPFC